MCTRTLSLTFSIQNVRSFNISTKNDFTIQKVIATCSYNTDLILLSDLRLNSIKQISAVNDLQKKFFLKGYKLFYNSNGPSRGTGILIRRKLLDSNLKILDQIADPDCNFLLLHLEHNSKKFVVVSVYGPNHDTEINFYENLRLKLKKFNCPLILGGEIL